MTFPLLKVLLACAAGLLFQVTPSRASEWFISSGGPLLTGEWGTDLGDTILPEDNIAVANTNPWSNALIRSAKTVVMNNNLIDDPGYVDKSVKLTETGTIMVDTKLVNPVVADFRLQPDSPRLRGRSKLEGRSYGVYRERKTTFCSVEPSPFVSLLSLAVQSGQNGA